MDTLRDALAAYLSVATDLRSASKLRHQVNRWEKHSSATLPIRECDVVAFRTSCLTAKLSATTIETTISDVLTILRAAGAEVPSAGRRLKKPQPRAEQPTVGEIGLLYDATKYARWPSRWGQQDRVAWWRGFIVLAYFWPYRLGDLLRLTTSDIKDAPGEVYPRAELVGSKTGSTYCYPLTDVCRRHLVQLLRIKETPGGHPNNGSLFMLQKGCVRFVRAEMRRLCGLAGIKPFGPQSIRRASITSYSCLGNDAGQIAHHGTIGGVRAHYVNAMRVLSQSMHNFDVPDEMLDPNERRRNRESLAQLMRVAKRMPASEIAKLARMAEAM